MCQKISDRNRQMLKNRIQFDKKKYEFSKAHKKPDFSHLILK